MYRLSFVETYTRCVDIRRQVKFSWWSRNYYETYLRPNLYENFGLKMVGSVCDPFFRFLHRGYGYRRRTIDRLVINNLLLTYLFYYGLLSSYPYLLYDYIPRNVLYLSTIYYADPLSPFRPYCLEDILFAGPKSSLFTVLFFTHIDEI